MARRLGAPPRLQVRGTPMMRSMTLLSNRPRLLLGASLLTLMTASTGAVGAESRVLAISAGPLEQSLTQLADQSHEQLLYPSRLVSGRAAPALKGRFTTDEALGRLLAGSDLVAARAGPHVLVLKSRAGTATDPAEAPTSGRPFADSLTPEVAEAAPTKLSEITVTGTHIRGVTGTASEVLVLDRRNLEQSGHLTVAAAVEALPQNFGGSATEGTVTGAFDRAATNSYYGSGVNLRGLGADATLVLMNGRRMAGTGAKGDFADLSTVPLAAVERVEVLLDGASALYGSDAVGGVVNVILRQRFEGAETRLTGGASDAGGGGEYGLAQSFGRAWSSGSLFLSYEAQRREALAAEDRAATASADLRPLGGSDRRLFYSHPGTVLQLVPALGALLPAFAIPDNQDGTKLKPGDFVAGASNLRNQRTNLDTLPEQDRQSAYAALRQEVGDRVELLADARYGDRDFRLKTGPSIALITATRANPFFVSPNGSASTLIAYSFGDEIPFSQVKGSEKSFGATLGATLALPHAWRSDVYLAYAEETGKVSITSLVNTANLSEALGSVPDRPATSFNTANDGFFNPFGGSSARNAPSVLAFVGSGYTTAQTHDRVATANIQLDGELWPLPGGPMRVALGAQERQERFERTALNYLTTPTPVAAVPAAGRRTVSAAFAELNTPIVSSTNARPGLQRLEVSLAGRYEHYDDFGDTANPKLGVIWSPLEGITLRGGYGRSYRAPALRELHDPQSYSAVTSLVGSTRVLSLFETGGNPKLDPETAVSRSLSVDFAPSALPEARASMTWFRTRFRNRIDQPARSGVSTALVDPALAPFVTRVSPASSAADKAEVAALLASPFFNPANGVFPAEAYGALIDARYVNTGLLDVEGVDLTGSYGIRTARDHVTFGVNLSYLLRYDQQLTPTARTDDRLGQVTYPQRLRGRFTTDWSRGDVGALAALNYMSGERDATGAHVDSQTTVDLQVRWEGTPEGPMAGVRAVFGVRNLLDARPPFYDAPVGVGYDAANADIIGRFVSLQLTKRW